MFTNYRYDFTAEHNSWTLLLGSTGCNSAQKLLSRKKKGGGGGGNSDIFTVLNNLLLEKKILPLPWGECFEKISTSSSLPSDCMNVSMLTDLIVWRYFMLQEHFRKKNQDSLLCDFFNTSSCFECRYIVLCFQYVSPEDNRPYSPLWAIQRFALYPECFYQKHYN